MREGGEKFCPAFEDVHVFSGAARRRRRSSVLGVMLIHRGKRNRGRNPGEQERAGESRRVGQARTEVGRERSGGLNRRGWIKQGPLGIERRALDVEHPPSLPRRHSL
eukprot:764310-Hanusia_phi.AAC.1